jgi:hypothetical protein
MWASCRWVEFRRQHSYQNACTIDLHSWKQCKSELLPYHQFRQLVDLRRQSVEVGLYPAIPITVLRRVPAGLCDNGI